MTWKIRRVKGAPAVIVARILSPTARARSRKAGCRILSIACSAAAHATGAPPYVPPMPPTWEESTISARPVTALIGIPPPSDFAMVMRSGTMP